MMMREVSGYNFWTIDRYFRLLNSLTFLPMPLIDKTEGINV